MSTFGEKLRGLREERNMSQEQLADLLGTSKQVISRYETNQRTPKITIAQEYAAILGVPLSVLIDDSVSLGSSLSTKTKLGNMALINERIKERRKACGLTLLEVAERLGVKEATMQRYESGAIKNIKHEVVVSLADIFRCSPAYLMGWEDEEPANKSLSKPLSDIKPEITTNPHFLTIEENFQKLNEAGQKHLAEYSGFLVSKEEYQAPVKTIRVFRAARSTNNTPPEWVDMPAEEVERIFNAPESDLDL